MITKERFGTIFKLAYPITIALSSSLIMALIDIAMVGTLGNSAVAAVGLASFSYTLITALVAGIAPAVQGLVARRRGEGSTELSCLPLNSGPIAFEGIVHPDHCNDEIERPQKRNADLCHLRV